MCSWKRWQWNKVFHRRKNKIFVKFFPAKASILDYSKHKSYSGIVSMLLLTGHSTPWISLLQRGWEGKPHVPPYHHPLCLHAAQLRMRLSHSPTAKSSENHAPLAYHRKGNTWGRRGRHGHTQRPNHKEVRQWTETSQRVENRGGGKWDVNRKQICRRMKVSHTNGE